MNAQTDDTSRVRVPLVEDEKTIIEFLTMGLTFEGFTVEAVRDRREALAAFEASGPISCCSM